MANLSPYFSEPLFPAMMKKPSIYRVLIVLLLIQLPASRCYAQLFDQLERNVKDLYLSNSSREADLKAIVEKLKKGEVVVKLPSSPHHNDPDTAAMHKLLNTITPEGAWKDLNYQDKNVSGWDPALHAIRIQTLTLCYSDPDSKYYKDKRVQETIHLALKYWYDTKPVCKNWWYNEIGVPRILGPSFIFLKPELSPSELTGAIAVMDHSSFKQTGQNKVWQAGNLLFKAILIRDAALAQRARDTIISELRISKEEGIQPDFSFHQHGPQQQMGNYGLALLNSMSFWSRVLAGSNLAINAEKLSILRNYSVNGFAWFSWKGNFDVNSLGRQFFSGAQKARSVAISNSMMDMMVVDPDHRKNYLNFIDINYNDHAGIHEPLGTRHYWNSDMTVHRSPKCYVTIKMSSDRIQATESGNGENLLGYHVGDGTTFIEVDGNEYEEIFPYWDWKKLPGVTSAENDRPLPKISWIGYRNHGDFTGGVTDGRNGITTFRLNRDSIRGNKSWFYLDDMLVCLGSGLHDEIAGEQLYTTINQTNLSGEVSYFTDAEHQLKKESSLTDKSLKWVYHHKVGYYFLQADSVQLMAKNQTGNWRKLYDADTHHEDVKGDVFTLGVKHHLNKSDDTYAYAILPAVSIEQLRNFKPDFEIVKNDAEAQVIARKNKTALWLAVYRPLKLSVPGYPQVNIGQPGLYLLEKSAGEWKIFASDPTQKLQQAGITINGKHHQLKLPQGDSAGSTVNEAL